MKRLMLTMVLAAAMVGGCKKKDGDKTEETPKPTGDTPAVTCDKGQIADGDKCVPVVTPEKVAAVKQQVTRLEELEKKLDQAQGLAAVIDLLDAVRQLDAWKKASVAPGFKEVDELVASLKQGSDELKAFTEQLKASKAKVADLGTTLEQIYEGTGAAKTLADARAKVTGELRAAIVPMQDQVVEAMKAIAPALEELKKLKTILDAACLLGSGDDFKKLCESSSDVFTKALAFLEANKDAPKVLLNDLVGQLEAQLGALVSAEGKQLLDTAQKAVDQALNAPADGDKAGDGE